MKEVPMAKGDVKIVTRKPRKCPFCGSLNVKPCLWGMPIVTKEHNPYEEYIVEGCERFIDMPRRNWGCKDCEASFYEKKSYERAMKRFEESYKRFVESGEFLE